MESVVSKKVNILSVKSDMASIRKVRGDFRGLVKAIQRDFDKLKIAPKLGKMPTLNLTGKVAAPRAGAGAGAASASGEMDKAAAAASKAQLAEEKFLATRELVIQKFLLSNRAIRNMNQAEQQQVREVLSEAKTREELSVLVAQERARISDAVAAQRKLNLEAEKNKVIQHQISSSIMHMAAGYASIYAIAEGFHKVIEIGSTLNGIRKGFIALTGTAEGARKEMAWVTKQATSMGVRIEDAADAYKNLMAAAGNKLPEEQIRKLFSGVAYASHIMGLSADKQQRVFLAVTQMMSKGKVQAEELQRQLGEALPISMRAMAAAAVKAGLVDKTLPAKQREAALLQLMKQGKVIASEVLPDFADALMDIVGKNKELTEELKTDWDMNLNTMSNSVTVLSNDIFKGLQRPLVYLMKNVSVLTDGNKTLAVSFGTVLGSAISSFTFPVRLAVAALEDMIHYTGVAYDSITNFFGISKETSDSIMVMTLKIIGMAAGFALFYKTMRKVVAVMRTFKSMSKFLGKAAATAKTVAEGGTEAAVKAAATGAGKAAGAGVDIAGNAARMGGEAAGAKTGWGANRTWGQGSTRTWGETGNSIKDLGLKGIGKNFIRGGLGVFNVYMDVQMADDIGKALGDALTQALGIKQLGPTDQPSWLPDWAKMPDEQVKALMTPKATTAWDDVKSWFSTPAAPQQQNVNVTVTTKTEGVENLIDTKVEQSHNDQYLNALSQLPQ